MCKNEAVLQPPQRTPTTFANVSLWPTLLACTCAVMSQCQASSHEQRSLQQSKSLIVAERSSATVSSLRLPLQVCLACTARCCICGDGLLVNWDDDDRRDAVGLPYQNLSQVANKLAIDELLSVCQLRECIGWEWVGVRSHRGGHRMARGTRCTRSHCGGNPYLEVHVRIDGHKVACIPRAAMVRRRDRLGPRKISPLYSIPHFSLTITLFPVKSARNGLGLTGTVCNRSNQSV
jgi:hypothetical protein